MRVQIYSKIENNLTSILVSDDKEVVYYHNVIDTPEFTGIQRGISYVKYNLPQYDTIELYSQETSIEDLLQDKYVQRCKLKLIKGENPSESLVRQCQSNLQVKIRWDYFKGGRII